MKLNIDYRWVAVGCHAAIFIGLFFIVWNMLPTEGVFFAALASFMFTGFSSVVAVPPFLQSRYVSRQREIKKPFGHQRVQILEQKWKLEDLKSKLPDPDGRLQIAIQQCDSQLDQINRAVIKLYETEFVTVQEQAKIVEQVEQTMEQTKKDLQESRCHLPTPQRVRQ